MLMKRNHWHPLLIMNCKEKQIRTTRCARSSSDLFCLVTHSQAKPNSVCGNFTKLNIRALAAYERARRALRGVCAYRLVRYQ